MAPDSTVTPELLFATPGVVDALAYAFDFELLSESTPPEDFTAVELDCRVVATDATGGAYARCSVAGMPPLFVHVDRGARYSVLSESFAELLRLVIELPYWCEVIERAGRGQLDALRCAAAEIEEEVRSDLPFFEAARADLLASLDLPAMVDPVAHLFATAQREVLLVARDGAPCLARGGRAAAARADEG